MLVLGVKGASSKELTLTYTEPLEQSQLRTVDHSLLTVVAPFRFHAHVPCFK